MGGLAGDVSQRARSALYLTQASCANESDGDIAAAGVP